ncbi:MAG: hypothetical protein HY262_09260 [Chloroflexi bacterium]|nr:hypothetical protein [Chloroflexota bacterium]
MLTHRWAEARQKILDLADEEFRWAAGFAIASGHLGIDGILAAVTARRMARQVRFDLSDDDFVQLLGMITFAGNRSPSSDEIVARLNALRPPMIVRPREVSRQWLRLEQALTRLWAAGIFAPTQAELAENCEPQIAERTLRGWLKREPGLRDLMPWLRAD